MSYRVQFGGLDTGLITSGTWIGNKAHQIVTMIETEPHYQTHSRQKFMRKIIIYESTCTRAGWLRPLHRIWNNTLSLLHCKHQMPSGKCYSEPLYAETSLWWTNLTQISYTQRAETELLLPVVSLLSATSCHFLCLPLTVHMNFWVFAETQAKFIFLIERQAIFPFITVRYVLITIWRVCNW